MLMGLIFLPLLNKININGNENKKSEHFLNKSFKPYAGYLNYRGYFPLSLNGAFGG
jgi:hypothetical protein